MTPKLKILIQILLINFLIFFFLGFKLAHSNSDTCNHFSNQSLQLKNQNYPKLIEIETPDTRKWFIKTLKSVGKYRINKEYKKYQKAKFKITYHNNVKCSYEGKIRIHGGRVDHIDIDKLNSSMRVVLKDGHIYNKYNFALIKKKTLSFDDEIFASTFFEKLGYLSGLNYKVKVIINGGEVEEFLFREIPTLEMAKDSKRNNGIFLQSNKNDFGKRKTELPYQRSIILNRIKNSDGIAKNNSHVLLFALDKLNYLYLNSLGIGNGRDCCEDKPNKSQTFMKQHYKSGNYSLNFSILDDEVEIEKNSIFNLLMNATNSTHGLAIEDRGFFYDPTFDRFEPFYRDGNTNILDQNNFNKESIRLFEFEKKYISKTINLIKSIDIDDFNKSLNKKGLELNNISLSQILNKIISNINKIKDFDLYSNHKNDFTKNYFLNHFDKDLNFNLAFGGINNEFEICDIKLQACKNIKIEEEKKDTLLNDKWLKLEQFTKPIMYVRLSKKDYINNLKPKQRGLKKFKTFKVNNNFVIYYNSPKETILINKEKREIILNQKKISNKFIFFGNDINNWNIKFNGAKTSLKDITQYKRDENMIGGCIALVNSEFTDISIEMFDNTCSKGIEVLNSVGSFQDIVITKSAVDAFDAEFSIISINKILIQEARGECIGLKRGKYKINGAILNECLDHSISVGEHAELEVNKIFTNNTASIAQFPKRVGLRGIMVKDSSKVILHEYKNINSRKCLLSLRKKDYYDGALIKVKKDKFSCEIADGLFKDKFSFIEFF